MLVLCREREDTCGAAVVIRNVEDGELVMVVNDGPIIFSGSLWRTVAVAVAEKRAAIAAARKNVQNVINGSSFVQGEHFYYTNFNQLGLSQRWGVEL